MYTNDIYQIELNRLQAGQTLAKEFISSYELMIESQLAMIETLLTESKQTIISEIKLSLNAAFSKLYIDYGLLQNDGSVNTLKEIYLSFLRTSCLNDYPIYQIDFYDKYGRFSDVECSRPWQCKVIFQYFYKLRDEMIQRFEKQQKIKAYILDKRIIQVAESVNQLAIPYIKAAIVEMMTGDEVLFKEYPEIYIGEFFDKVEKVEI